MYDVIIIGGGPGGVAAGVYVARKQLKALFLTENFASQSTVSSGIENWIGTLSVTGWEYGQMLEKHLRAHEGLEIKTGAKVVKVEETSPRRYRVTTEAGEQFETKTIIIASGGRHRHLDIPGEEKFAGKGVVYCSTCDAPFFKERKVAVIGGGNAALEAVEDLLPYASDITLLVRSELRGDPITQKTIEASPKVKILFHVVPVEIIGEKTVEALRFKNTDTQEEQTMPLQGVFVEIGMVPNTEFVKGLLELNPRGEIVLDHRTKATSRPGIYATGDATDAPYKQNNISAGDGVVAALSAYDYLRKGNA